MRAIDPAHPNELPSSARAAASPPRGPAPPPRPAGPIASAVAPEKTHKPALYLQVGAFSDHGNAERAAETLRRARLGEVGIVASQVGGRTIERVRLGPLRDADEVDRLTPRVRALGLGEPRAAIDD